MMNIEGLTEEDCIDEEDEEELKCEKCGKDGLKACNGLFAKIIPFDTVFICDDCLQTNKTIEELVIEINHSKKG